MKTHPYSQTVQYILALGFMGELMIASENENPGKIRNQKTKQKFHLKIMLHLWKT